MTRRNSDTGRLKMEDKGCLGWGRIGRWGNILSFTIHSTISLTKVINMAIGFNFRQSGT
jgi:hypothetical protein